jgi:urea carboxylase
VFKKILIANRGAIACRIMRTLRTLGVTPVCVYTTADADSRHVLECDDAVWIGEGSAAESYLDGAKIITAARTHGATAIHPGYGFLSENAAFAEACAAAGIAFIGPTPSQLRDFGLKHTARALAKQCGLPLLPGTELLADRDAALQAVRAIGYPVMLKSTAGGGGIGMQLCRDDAELATAFDSVQRISRNNFADAGVYLEKFVTRARHIEVQIFGDGAGNVISLGERDCSTQRRNQKVIEEAPAPGLSAATREALSAYAVALGKSVHYRSAGTVEYVFDADTDAFYFLEVNTRLQVEHGVTEAITGIDLVEWMIRLAAEALPNLNTLKVTAHGHAVQARVYAEDPARDFQPSTGLLTDVAFPTDLRCDTWVTTGVEVSPYYDPLLAKVIAKADTRTAALAALDRGLGATRLAGIVTNLAYLRSVLNSATFTAGVHTTGFLATHTYLARTIEVLAPGTESTVQDFPGREGYWHVGVPPSGPMDDYAFQIANRLVGNARAAGFEFTVTGPTLKFNTPALVAITGADMGAMLNGVAAPCWQAFEVPAGATLTFGAANGGIRTYLAVRGGIEVPEYLGSRSTFILGRFGGHGGRALRLGDVLAIGAAGAATPLPLASELIPHYSQEWQLRVIYGPHGAPDFFLPEDIAMFFEHAWEVHYHSSRTGVRLIGPKPTWARADGGDAGLHPSNLHDNAYAIGAIDFTGDMPVILGPDGPSLGGFVCPAVVIAADRWRLGQLRPGDRVRFVPVSHETAIALAAARATALETLAEVPQAWTVETSREAVLARRISADQLAITYRPAGDEYLLIEFGPQVLDIDLRFRVQALLNRLEALRHPAIIDLTPGIRSLQIHYRPRQLPRDALMEMLDSLQSELGDLTAIEVPSRIVHLPLAWDDPSTQVAIDKYMQSVRADAPWCPSNIEFIRRINGLASEEAVREIVYSASYLVMGLGDVYLGAPVATPLDPRHRLVTTKYNPARTWTPENAVGIGGAYMCIYGMEGPGGYQFVGRTLQMWNRYRATPAFTQPWLLRFFDQIRFFPVTSDELARIRADFPRGRYALKIEDTRFKLADYNRFLAQNAASIVDFKQTQQAAFAAERARWVAADQDLVDIEPAPEVISSELVLTPGQRALPAHVHGSIWQINVEPGQRVAAGDSLLVIESMKMEITVVADQPARVAQVLCKVGTHVAPGQILVILEAA